MEKASIFHEPKYRDAFAVGPRTVEVKIRTKKHDAISVECIYGDPYNVENGLWLSKSTPMTHKGSCDRFDYWSVFLSPLHKRLRYGFRISNMTDILFYTEKGIFKTAPQDVGSYFCFPFLNQADIFTPPEWARDTVWYQIFPERFANGNPSLNPENTLPWGKTPPSPSNFFGGDIQGITEKLDYLQRLGITGIYLTPIFKAKSNHKYDTIDYMNLDPQFGTKEDLKILVKKCHQRNIRVMLDAVFNHSGFFFPPFQDVLENGEDSDYKDWFHVSDFPVVTEPYPNYDTFGYVASMPKLNTENPHVKEYLLNAAVYWIREFDIDGWRLDVANEVDHDFWRDFRKTVKKEKPDLFILGEVWHDSMPWLLGDQFDSVMNYPFTQAVLDYGAYGTLTTTEFAKKLVAIQNHYPTSVNQLLFNLLGSHDTPRILTQVHENKELLEILYVMLFTAPGTPCIYYGDEIGITGDQDPGCRKCMVWEEEEQDRELFTFIQSLIQLRTENPALTHGKSFSINLADNDKKILIYRIQGEGEDQDLIVTLCLSPTEQHVTLPADLHEFNRKKSLMQKGLSLDGETVIFQPFSYAIFST